MATESNSTKTISDSELDALLNFGDVESPDNQDNSDDPNPLRKSNNGVDDELNKGLRKSEEEKKKAREEAAAKSKLEADEKKKLEEEELKKKAAQTAGDSLTEEEIAKTLNLNAQDTNTDSDEDNSTSSAGHFIDAIKDLVKDETLFLLEPEDGKDDKPLEQYSKKEIVAVLKGNQDRLRKELEEKVPQEFFDSLPEDMQSAAAYVANGGKDLKKIFKQLSDKVEIETTDIKTVTGQEDTVKKWLSSTGLTEEEVQEELNSLKDMPGALEKKAAIYKPKLEALHQSRIEGELKKQEAIRKAKEDNVKKYQEAVHNTIATGELNGIRITPSVQGMIYNGMAQSLEGFSELLKHTGLKTDLTLLSEAYWLLKDPKGYKEALKAVGSQETAAETAIKLKTAQSNKASSGSASSVNNTPPKKQDNKRIKRSANIFSRT